MTFTLSDNLCSRALDHGRHARGDGRLLRHLESHLKFGVLNAQERVQTILPIPGYIAEPIARLMSGRLREPHNEVYVLSPKMFPEEGLNEEMFDKFSRKIQSVHRALIGIEAPHRLDRGKGGNFVIGGDIPVCDRRIVGVFIRSQYLQSETTRRINELCEKKEIPCMDIREILK